MSVTIEDIYAEYMVINCELFEEIVSFIKSVRSVDNRYAVDELINKIDKNTAWLNDMIKIDFDMIGIP